MSDAKPETPMIVIPRRHQSAPNEHWADTELRKAAEEINSGNYVVPQSEDEFFNYGPSQFLARHPRVQEALAKLEKEREESNSQEAAEKAQMIYEMNEMIQRPDQWDGQGRWTGKENEEMRVVNIMTPFTFIEKLYASGISENRIWLRGDHKLGRAPVMSWERNLLMGTQEQVAVGTLQYPCGPEWMVMRFNEYGVPTNAKYLGWRTALLSMITLGVLSEKEAHKAFPLGEGPAAHWYREQLQVHRSQRGSKGREKYAN